MTIKILSLTALTVSLFGTSALASEPVALENSSTVLGKCLNAAEANNRTIRLCSDALKESGANDRVRYDIYKKRAVLKLAKADYRGAQKDFKAAYKLNDTEDLLSLGLGYSALNNKDLATAERMFTKCADNQSLRAYADFGMGMAKELSGDKDNAMLYYESSAELLPSWDLPGKEMVRLKGS